MDLGAGVPYQLPNIFNLSAFFQSSCQRNAGHPKWADRGKDFPLDFGVPHPISDFSRSRMVHPQGNVDRAGHSQVCKAPRAFGPKQLDGFLWEILVFSVAHVTY